MTRTAFSRYLLYGLLAALVGWLMWLVPQPKSGVSSTVTRHDVWAVPKLKSPENPQVLARRIAQRQGWQADASGASSGESNHKQTVVHILGIVGRGAHDRGVLTLSAKGDLLVFKPGQNLPDGRHIVAIHGASVILRAADSGKGKPEVFHLFPVDPKHLSAPKVKLPATAS